MESLTERTDGAVLSVLVYHEAVREQQKVEWEVGFERGIGGIEPPTSCTRSTNHTTRPNPRP